MTATTLTAPPRWYWIVAALAVLWMLFGVLALRKAWAVPVLALSLIAVIVQFYYLLVQMGAVEALGPAAALPFPLTLFGIGLALLLLARHARQRGWIG